MEKFLSEHPAVPEPVIPFSALQSAAQPERADHNYAAKIQGMHKACPAFLFFTVYAQQASRTSAISRA